MWQFRLIARQLAACRTGVSRYASESRLYSTKPRIRSRWSAKPPIDPSPPTKSPEIDPRTAFHTELRTLDSYATLLNQTSARSVHDLVDVRPLMAIYQTLPRSLINFAAPKVVNALKQTAKDAAYFSRSFPQQEKLKFQYEVGQALVPHVDQIAQLVIKNQIKDPLAISQLFRTFDHLDPYRGVQLYEQMPNKKAWGGAVIPLLVKTNAPLVEIRRAFECEALDKGGLEFVNPRTAANMVLALVKYDEVVAGEALFATLMESSAVDDITKQFLIDIFLGDAPAAHGRRCFYQFPAHVPHHSAMARLLASLSEISPFDEQLAIFGEYLRRLSIPSEMSIKPVAQQIVTNLFKRSVTVETVVDPIVELCAVYAQYVSEHELLLNIILSKVSEHFPQSSARPLILNLLSNYPPTASLVSYRVRLNALEHINAPELVAELWERRQASAELQKWDWFALLRADQGGEYFQSQWVQHNRPFITDMQRFRKSRRY